MIRPLLRNIASNWAGFAVQALLAFVLTPLVIQSLGTVRYGIWALIMSLTGYCGLLDLGFRSGMTQYMTRHLANRDFEKLNESASTAFVALLCCGLGVLCLGTVLFFAAPHVFKIPAALLGEARWCILILGISIALQFAYYPFASVFAAAQRYDLSNAVIIVVRLTSGAAIFVALRHGLGLIQLSLIQAVADQVLYATLMIVSRSVLPELVISPRLARWQSLTPIFNFGFWNFFVAAGTRLKTRSDAVIIGSFMPVTALVPYFLALNLADYFEALFAPIGYVFFPFMTHLDAKGDAATTRNVYLSGTKILLLTAAAGGAITAIWASDFFRLWVRYDVTEGGAYPQPAVIYWILIGASILASGQHIGCQTLAGARRVRILSFLAVGEVSLNILLSIALIHRFGLAGVAIGTLAAALCFQGVVLPLITCRFLSLPASEYFRKALLRAVIVLLTVIGVFAPLVWRYGRATTWSHLLLFGSLSVVGVIILATGLGLTRSEQHRIIFQPASRLFRSITSFAPKVRS